MKPRHSVAVAVWLPAAAAFTILLWLWWRVHLQSARTAVQIAPAIPANNTLRPPATNRAPAPVLPTTLGNLPRDLAPPPMSAASTNAIAGMEERAPAEGYPRGVQSVFELQVALARQCLSPGSIDGLIGPQTRAALRSFQQKERLPVTGELDNATKACLLLTAAPTSTYEVTSNDLARLQPLSPTWLGKSRQSALDYETLLELVSEKAHTHPALVKQLNPDLDWDKIGPESMVRLPNVSYTEPARRAAGVTIRLADKVLEAWDENTNLLAHFPCSIARLVEKRPVGELHVAVIAHNPNYTFDPENFPESPEAQQLKTKLVLPPGPNNPVGVAWIGLDKPGYGIHGTPNPELVGRTESHGCFRLANWNADYLARMVEIGTPVYVQP